MPARGTLRAGWCRSGHLGLVSGDVAGVRQTPYMTDYTASIAPVATIVAAGSAPPSVGDSANETQKPTRDVLGVKNSPMRRLVPVELYVTRYKRVILCGLAASGNACLATLTTR